MSYPKPIDACPVSPNEPPTAMRLSVEQALSEPIQFAYSEGIYLSKWTSLRVDHVRLADGSSSIHDIIERGHSIIVVPFRRGRILLVRQYRYAVQSWTLECPAGRRDAGESPLSATARELREETGYIADEFHSLGSTYAGITNSTDRVDIFAARVKARTVPKLEPSELGMSAEWYGFTTVREMLRTGEIDSLPCVAALSLFFQELDGSRTEIK